MAEVTYDAGFESFTGSGPDTKHLNTTYRLTCYQGDHAVIFRLSRMDSNHPGRIQWTIPVKVGYQCAMIEVSDDGSLEWIGTPDGVVDPKPRPQQSPPARDANDSE